MGNCLHCMANGAKRSKASTETKKQQGSENLGNPFKMCMKPRDTRVQASSEKKTAAQNGEKGAMRVKIVLTKKEATLLLSQCNGDEEKMKNLLSELEKMKSINNNGNITFTDKANIGDAWKPGLESIPEGCCVLVF